MFGLIGWVTYGAFASTRLTEALHRQLVDVDILDLRPFEPAGRQSLLIALAFVGGTTLSMFFALTPETILSWPSLFIYGVFVSVTVLAFFFNMRPTHRVLAETKQREMDTIQRQIARTYRTLKQQAAEGLDTRAAAAELDTWLACEQRFKAARTWPYDLDMLRTLFVSVLIPAGAALARLVADTFFK